MINKKRLLQIFLLGLFIRLGILYIFKNTSNYDIESYKFVGESILKKINIYPQIAQLHYPYLPLYLYIEAGAMYLTKFGLDSIVFLKIVNIIFDMGTLLLIYEISRKSIKKTLLYALNPVTILVSSLHGQFDTIPIMLILLSFYLLDKKKEFLSILVYSTAVLIKTWPIILIFHILAKLHNKRLISLLFLMPTISIVLYSFLFKINPIEILKTNFQYHGLFGIWGVTYFLSFFKLSFLMQKVISFLLLITIALYGYFYTEKNIIKGAFVFLLFFFSFTPGFSIQYLSWIIPFLILVQPKNWWKIHLLLIITVILNNLIFLLPEIRVINSIFIISSLLTWISILKSWWNNKDNLLFYQSK